MVAKRAGRSITGRLPTRPLIEPMRAGWCSEACVRGGRIRMRGRCRGRAGGGVGWGGAICHGVSVCACVCVCARARVRAWVRAYARVCAGWVCGGGGGSIAQVSDRAASDSEDRVGPSMCAKAEEPSLSTAGSTYAWNRRRSHSTACAGSSSFRARAQWRVSTLQGQTRITLAGTVRRHGGRWLPPRDYNQRGR